MTLVYSSDLKNAYHKFSILRDNMTKILMCERLQTAQVDGLVSNTADAFIYFLLCVLIENIN